MEDDTFSRFSSHEAHDTRPERQSVPAGAPIWGRGNGNAILPVDNGVRNPQLCQLDSTSLPGTPFL